MILHAGGFTNKGKTHPPNYVTDVLNTDNWQTDIFFTPFAGINLFLWKDEVRWHFKIAQVGPEARSIDAAPEEMSTVADTEFCEPVCLIERTNFDFVSFSLPGGQPGKHEGAALDAASTGTPARPAAAAEIERVDA